MNVSLKPFLCGAAILAVGLNWGCGEQKRGDRVETFPVTGEVYVDGQAVENLQVSCNNVLGVSQENPITPRAFTGPGGKFSLATYEAGDGVPKGEYTLTFQWGQPNPFHGYTGDKLNGRYAEPKASQFKLTVTDQPVELGKIELTSK